MKLSPCYGEIYSSFYFYFILFLLAINQVLVIQGMVFALYPGEEQKPTLQNMI